MNVRSMTGYGRSETLTEEYRLVVEIKSVNHRFLDLNIRMPRLFNRFEASIRSLLKTYIERGKVDLFITYEDYLRGESGLKYNRVLCDASGTNYGFYVGQTVNYHGQLNKVPAHIHNNEFIVKGSTGYGINYQNLSCFDFRHNTFYVSSSTTRYGYYLTNTSSGYTNNFYDNSLVVQCGDRDRFVDFYDIYTIQYDPANKCFAGKDNRAERYY